MDYIEEQPSEQLTKPIEIVDNSKRANRLLTILRTNIGLLLVAITVGALLLYFSSNQDMEQENFEFSHSIVLIINGLVGVFQFVVFILTAVFFISWFRRSYGNLIRLDYSGISKKENMALWGWIIPFVNIVYPYQIMNEIWQGNQIVLQEENSNQIPQKEPLLGLWWMAYIISSIVSNVVTRMSFQGQFTEFEESLAFLISDCIDIIGIVITMQLVKKVILQEQSLEARVLNHGGEIRETV